MARANPAQEDEPVQDITTGLQLASRGAWFDQQYRCIPGRNDDGAMTVLVHIAVWNAIVSRVQGDLEEATRVVCQRTLRFGKWRMHDGVPALLLSQH